MHRVRAGRGHLYTAVHVMAAPKCGMKGAYMTSLEGWFTPKVGGARYGPCCSGQKSEADLLPAGGRRRTKLLDPQARREGMGQWAGGIERGNESKGVVRAGTFGVQERYVYTGKKSARSPYIAERAQSRPPLHTGAPDLY